MSVRAVGMTLGKGAGGQQGGIHHHLRLRRLGEAQRRNVRRHRRDASSTTTA